MSRGQTTYSDEIKGETRNFKMPVRFDMTDGFLGITQNEGADRVLLSPEQVRWLLAFIGKQ